MQFDMIAEIISNRNYLFPICRLIGRLVLALAADCCALAGRVDAVNDRASIVYSGPIRWSCNPLQPEPGRRSQFRNSRIRARFSGRAAIHRTRQLIRALYPNASAATGGAAQSAGGGPARSPTR
jgi:hypothetical protein